jgi:SpoVK/Ycf46/Vps4 family AAA+-type ATPase
MPPPTPDLFLIAGIPGTGKTTFAESLSAQFGFVHTDLEDQPTLSRFAANPTQFIADLVSKNKDTVVTWGFAPDHQPSVALVLEFKTAGFKLIWFDGDRPAALRAFQKRGTVPEVLFYLQMYKIEATKIIDAIKPAVIDSFDAKGEFKSPAVLLKELRQK